MAAVGWLSMEFGGGAQRLWIWNTAFLGGVTDNCLALAREKEEGTCLGGEHGVGVDGVGARRERGIQF